jgi:murein DD-endopeptidase MepM/ murein hydrolase activator NlpD
MSRSRRRQRLRSVARPLGAVALALILALAQIVLLTRPASARSAAVDPAPVGVWPLQPTPTVVEGFDPPGSPWDAGHRGVDLAGTVGEVVHTALAGKVAFASVLAGRGVVVVDHGSTRTTYEPVAAGVRVGDVVSRGQPIGTLELSGSHCFPRACLHWGWKRGSTYLDPLLLVGGGPIVLLPLAGTPVLGLGAPEALPRADRTSPPVPHGPVWRRPLAMRPLLM